MTEGKKNDKSASTRNGSVTAVLLRTREKDESHFKNAGKDEIHSENPGKAIKILPFSKALKVSIAIICRRRIIIESLTMPEAPEG